MKHHEELERLIRESREEIARERELRAPARAAARTLRLRRTLWRTMLRLARARSGLGEPAPSAEQPEKS